MHPGISEEIVRQIMDDRLAAAKQARVRREFRRQRARKAVGLKLLTLGADLAFGSAGGGNGIHQEEQPSLIVTPGGIRIAARSRR